MTVILSHTQNGIFDQIMRWQRTDEQVFVLAGYAGTGKSTLAARIADEVGVSETYYCAYTGKAANVLREKGCENARTIHGWLYNPSEHSQKALEDLKKKSSKARGKGNTGTAAALEKEIEDLVRRMKQPKFELDMDSPLKKAGLVIVDEYSMLPDKIIADLKKVAKKILFIGDPYQLPPVEGECSLKPDAFLEEIHRQALGSGIITYSKVVREGGYIPHGRHGDLDFLYRPEAGRDVLLSADQVICGRNNTRTAMNAWFRKERGIESKYPVAGEKLICLKNNHPAGRFNGMIGNTDSDARFCGMFCYIDFDGMEGIRAFTGDFTGDGGIYDFRNPAHRELDRFTFGSVITAHKSQGSEFGRVVVLNEPIGRGEERRRWLYTSLTRAKEHCTLVETA
jgi:exodeoxyribonuclease-5